MSFDPTALRPHFPALAGPDAAAHFDGPGGSQTPRQVADAVAAALVSPLANRGTVTTAERNADAIVLAARRAMADLLGADPAGVIFGRSMTQLTMDTARTLSQTWRPGDEVVVTRLDHDANIRPWVIAASVSGRSCAGQISIRRPVNCPARRSPTCSPSAPGWWRSPRRPT